MEKHVIDTTREHQVEVGLHLAQRRAEVFGEPCEGLAGGKRLTHDVGGGGRVLQHTDVTEVRTCESRITPQSLDTEVGKAKAFNLRDVNSAIEVEQVGG